MSKISSTEVVVVDYATLHLEDNHLASCFHYALTLHFISPSQVSMVTVVLFGTVVHVRQAHPGKAQGTQRRVILLMIETVNGILIGPCRTKLTEWKRVSTLRFSHEEPLAPSAAAQGVQGLRRGLRSAAHAHLAMHHVAHL